MAYAGDPDDGGVVWPRIAEISLLGALGCGRALTELVIEELSAQNSQYDFVALQATDNSIPFYESLGFIRVGAVARYTIRSEEAEMANEGKGDGMSLGQEDLEYDFSRSYVTSPFKWFLDTKDNGSSCLADSPVLRVGKK